MQGWTSNSGDPPRRTVFGTLGILVLLVAPACSDDGSDDAGATSTVATTAAPTSPDSSEVTPASGLNAAQRRRADQLISAFENSTTTISYDYAENLGDGRGVTAGRAGFTTATCDALAVIDLYSTEVPDNAMTRYLPELNRLCEGNDDDTSGLPEAEFMASWREAASDERFRAAQDAIVDREYFVPAMEAADRAGVSLAITRAQIYDTAIQHGAGDDLDSMGAIIQRTTERVGAPDEAGQEAWFEAFLTERIAVLENPANTDTAEAWRESVDRVECFRRIAATGNFDLHGPITFHVYSEDDQFTID